MSTIDTLLDRVSTAALREPGPTGAALDRILETGLRAPDHGRLRPWRFVLVRGAALGKLADLAAQAARERESGASEAVIDKQRGKMLRAPLIIALVARLSPNHKIPEYEQVLSVGAAGMNILNAVHAEGFAGMWITGANCYDPAIQHALGVTEPERLAGFLFVGMSAAEHGAVVRPSLAEHVTEWTGANAGP